jgi:DNA-binding Lrp family transcriptional regulator
MIRSSNSTRTPKYLFDRLDQRIIRELTTNLRVDAAKIARAVGANERTVRKRINRLVELEAIQLAALVNPRSFGYTVTLEVILEVAPDYEETVVSRLLAMSEISYVAYGQNEQEIALQAHFKVYEETRAFVRRTLPALPGVTVKNSKLVPRILGNVDRWQPDFDDFGDHHNGSEALD